MSFVTFLNAFLRGNKEKNVITIKIAKQFHPPLWRNRLTPRLLQSPHLGAFMWELQTESANIVVLLLMHSQASTICLNRANRSTDSRYSTLNDPRPIILGLSHSRKVAKIGLRDHSAFSFGTLSGWTIHISANEQPAQFVVRWWCASEAVVNPFTPKSDQFWISPAALHYTAWRTWLFI